MTPTPAVTETPDISPILQRAASVYVETAEANVRQIGDRLAVVPSPAYANGIYGRDAFYTALGLGDLELSEQAFRWFEAAQDAASGQITTAIPFDPGDTSLEPQDDETTIIFLIWAGLLYRQGRPVDETTVRLAFDFVQSHVEDGRYVSRPGQFRYWADCYELKRPDMIAYNQGLYALALRLLADTKLAEVTGAMVEEAVQAYQDQFRADRQRFGALSRRSPGRELQDLSALLPEFLHRLVLGHGLLANETVMETVNHHLATAAVRDHSGTLLGLKALATTDGQFADPANFACPTLRNPGDYQNGGHWPLFASVVLALAYSIEPQPAYRVALETLAEQELHDGSPKEYWKLSPGNESYVHPGRSTHAWNVLIVPALQMAGLVE